MQIGLTKRKAVWFAISRKAKNIKITLKTKTPTSFTIFPQKGQTIKNLARTG